MILTVLCLIYYITASIEMIPSLYRMWKRKSSTDYSLVSAWIQMTGTIAWTIYIYLSKQSMVVYVGTAFDMIMAVLYLYFIVRYHNREET